MNSNQNLRKLQFSPVEISNVTKEGVGAFQRPKHRAKNLNKPQNRNKFRPQPKTETKPLTDKDLAGF